MDVTFSSNQEHTSSNSVHAICIDVAPPGNGSIHWSSLGAEATADNMSFSKQVYTVVQFLAGCLLQTHRKHTIPLHLAI